MPRQLIPVTLPHTSQYIYTSQINATSYTIKLYTPPSPPPPSGYPTLLLLDGTWYFPTFVDLLHTGFDGTNTPMAIIGVCSSDVEKAIVTRVKDFTPTKQSNAERNITHTPEEFVQGGAKDFLRVLTEEVLPDVGELIKVDRDKVTLLGFSLGGLFGLYTMFTQASLFQTYLIISPSIWYNDKYILSLFPKFKERILAESTARPRVYLAAGGNECVPNHEWPGDNAEERRQVCDFCRMVDNVVDLAKDFDGIGLEQEAWRRIFQNFEGETHPRMIFAAASAAVRFALDGLVVESDDEKVSEP